MRFGGNDKGAKNFPPKKKYLVYYYTIKIFVKQRKDEHVI